MNPCYIFLNKATGKWEWTCDPLAQEGETEKKIYECPCCGYSYDWWGTIGD